MRRRTFVAGAGAALLAGCGDPDDPRLNRATRDKQARTIGIDYASFYAPYPDVKRLALARAAAVGAELTFSDDASGSAAQVETLKTWTGPSGGFRAVVVAPFDRAAVEPVARAALDRDVAIVSYVAELEAQSAAIRVDLAHAARLLADAAPAGGVLLVVPPDPPVVPDPFAAAFAPARAVLEQRTDVVITVAATGAADATLAVAAALTPAVRSVLCWNDTTALGAAAALGRGPAAGAPPPNVRVSFVGGLGAPSLSSAASLRALGDRTLSALVAPRLSALAAALVDVPLAIARGGPARSRTVPVALLRAGDSRLRAYARDIAG